MRLVGSQPMLHGEAISIIGEAMNFQPIYSLRTESTTALASEKRMQELVVLLVAVLLLSECSCRKYISTVHVVPNSLEYWPDIAELQDQLGFEGMLREYEFTLVL